MKLRRKKRMQETVELNITAFLNLMVILVPFLLITAVFSRMTILELNLPSLDAQAASDEKVKLQLQLLVRPDSFDIQDANLGLIKRFAHENDKVDWNAFTEMLVDIKTRFPEETAIALLLAPSVSYKTLIQIMDRVKYAEIMQYGSLESVELFPDISIGDAPVFKEESSEIQEAISE